MLQHLVSWPREHAEPPHPCLVLLHGRGSNEQDLFGLVPQLPKRPLVLSVRAPNPFGWGGYFWYDFTGEQGRPDESTLNSSLDQLRELLVALPEKYQVDASQVYLLGFSQGALMSGTMTLKEPELIAGTIMLSGYLPEIDVKGDGVTGKPVFMAHGTNDGVLPVVMARQARLRLEELRAELEYHEYAMEHEVSLDELNDLQRWFQARGLR